jgi:putative transposase
MPRYVRAHIPGGTFFFTVALLERRRALLTTHIELLREAFRAAKRLAAFNVSSLRRDRDLPGRLGRDRGGHA